MGKILSGATEYTIGDSWADGEYLKIDTGEIVTAAAGGGGGITVDTFSNRPAAGTVGAEFVATDTYMPVRCIDNGSAWKNYYNGFLCTDPPAAGDLSQIHFSLSAGTASLTDVGDGLLFTQSGNNSTSNRDSSWAVAAIPGSGAYTLTVGFMFEYTAIPFSWGGLVVTDGNGATPKGAELVFVGRTTGEYNQRIEVLYETNPTTFSAEEWLPLTIYSPVFFRIYDDRTTNLYFYYSLDGSNFKCCFTLARTAHLTPAYIGVVLGQAGYGSAGGAAVPTTDIRSSMKIFHWSLG